MGMSTRCQKCGGTGNMGFTIAQRCDACSGKGIISIYEEEETLLVEFVEGYNDRDTEDSWLEAQLKRLIKARRKKFAKNP